MQIKIYVPILSVLICSALSMPLLFNTKHFRIQSIIAKCASLHETYKPPWWCFGPWMNVLIMLIKEKLGPFIKPIRLNRETIICPDGGKSRF